MGLLEPYIFVWLVAGYVVLVVLERISNLLR